MDYGAHADGISVDNDAIQRAINSFDVITFPAGTYLIDDRDYIRIPSNRRLIFKKGAVVKFINSKNHRFGAVFYIKGDNVCIEGLVFQSPSMVSRALLSNTDQREGESSLATVIMSGGNNVSLKNITIENAEFGFFLSGNNYTLSNIRVTGSQPLYAENCNDLSIRNFRSKLPDYYSCPLDHHIYLKGDCERVTIDRCVFIGGSSFAIQLSSDYNNPTQCPKSIEVSRTTISGSSKCIVIDNGNTTVTCSKIHCQGVEGDLQSYFAGNRGGQLIVKESRIEGFTFIERDYSSRTSGNRGSSLYSNCTFSFLSPESCAFDLSCLDELSIQKCKFNYLNELKSPGFIVKVDDKQNAVGKVQLSDNSFFIQQATDNYVRILSTGTRVIIENNKFYNLGNDINIPIPANTSNLFIGGNYYTGTTSEKSEFRAIEQNPKFRGKSFVNWLKLTHRIKTQ